MSKTPTVLSEIPDFITSKRADIATVCREFGVSKLEVFGSVMTDEFDSGTSDIDFVVRFETFSGLTDWIDRRAGLRDGLTALLGYEADLVELQTGDFSDPFMRRWANPTRRVIFDALQGGPAPERRPSTDRVTA